MLEDASAEKQIIVATHSPDVIEESPLQSCVWVDKSKSAGIRVGDVGKCLSELGAISHTQAIDYVGSDVLLYFEASPDRRAFEVLLQRCGKGELLDRAILKPLKGFGNAQRLPGAVKILADLRNINIAVVAVLDTDYTSIAPTATIEVSDGVLIGRLPCKELENLLLMSPQTIMSAVEDSAERRAEFGASDSSRPSLDLIEQKIDEISSSADVRSLLWPQWMSTWLTSQKRNARDPAALREANEQFEELWCQREWRRRCCPGKEILKRLRDWIRDDYKLSISNSQLFSAYEPIEEVRELFDRISTYVEETLPAD